MKQEIKFGIIALVTAVLVFIGLNYLAGSPYFGRPMVLYADYPEINGLFPGNRVFIKGVQVGKVSEVSLQMQNGFSGSYTRVKIELDKQYSIPTASEAMVYSIDLLGEKGIQILVQDSLGSSNGPFLQSGDDIRGTIESGIFAAAEDLILTEGAQIIVELGRLTVQLNDIVKQTRRLIADEQYATTVKATLENIQLTTANLAGIAQQADSISRELTGISRNAASIVDNFEDNNENITQILTNVKNTTDSLNSASSEIKQLMESANGAVGSVESFVSKLESTDGTLGLLLNDRQLYDSLNNTTANVNSLLREIQENPQRFFDDIKLYLIERRKKEAKEKP